MLIAANEAALEADGKRLTGTRAAAGA